MKKCIKCKKEVPLKKASLVMAKDHKDILDKTEIGKALKRDDIVVHVILCNECWEEVYGS